MNSFLLRMWLAVAVLLSLAYGGYTYYRVESHRAASERSPSVTVVGRPAAAPFVPNRRVSDFELTDQSDQPFGTAQLRGKVWVASFFFASCPGVCKNLNLQLAAVQAATPNDVLFVSITCDPDIDTPETLARYADVFHADGARWKFLTGPMSKLKVVGQDIFQVALDKETHSEKAFVVDRAGRIQGRFNVLDETQRGEMIKLIQRLAAEPAPEAIAEPASTDETNARPAANSADTGDPSAPLEN